MDAFLLRVSKELAKEEKKERKKKGTKKPIGEVQ
jgi:hypothetical protein